MFWAVFSLFANHFPFAFLDPPVVLHSFLRPADWERREQTEGPSEIILPWAEGGRKQCLWGKSWVAEKQGGKNVFP